MSSGAAKQLANNQTQSAVVAAGTPYCVARFEQQPNAVASWQALKKSTADYNQSDYVTKGGWATLAGEKADPGYYICRRGRLRDEASGAQGTQRRDTEQRQIAPNISTV
jgi:hypothetical protein